MRHILVAAGFVLAIPLCAAELPATSPGSFSWEENAVTGPVFEQTPQGWRIYTHVTQPVRIGDRRGIENAKIIAEERAKGVLVSYMHDHATNFRSHVQADIERDTTTADTEGRPNNGTLTRDSTDALMQAQTSFASGDLYGVTVLAQDYDEKNREVTVKVGMSSKSAAQAREMSRAMTEARSEERPPAPVSRDAGNAQGSRNLPGSETHHLKGDNW